MALTHTPATRNALATATLTESGNSATISFYDSGDVVLATFTCQTTSGTVTGPNLDYDLVDTTVAILATGTKSYFRVNQAGGDEVWRGDCTVQGGGGEYQTLSPDPASLDLIQGNNFTLNTPIRYTAPA